MDDLRGRAKRWGVVFALAIVRGGTTPSRAAAQRGPRLVCATPGPLQECHSFILLEVTGQSPFAPAVRPSLHQSLGWNLGAAANVAEALGGLCLLVAIGAAFSAG
jgi:hypothetical protein